MRRQKKAAKVGFVSSGECQLAETGKQTTQKTKKSTKKIINYFFSNCPFKNISSDSENSFCATNFLYLNLCISTATPKTGTTYSCTSLNFEVAYGRIKISLLHHKNFDTIF
jgi:hypothetical protein